MGPMILVIEQDLPNREFLETFLKFEGYRVIVAATVDGALRMMREQRPALVLANAQLPGVDIRELNTEMKNDQSIGAIPVIMLVTRIMMPSDETAIAETGAVACLSMPINTALLRRHIKQCIYGTGV
jgi:CheY-like chemotaxis protein